MNFLDWAFRISKTIYSIEITDIDLNSGHYQ